MFDIEMPDINLEFFKSWVRVDHDMDDLELSLCLNAAKSNVQNAIGTEVTEDSDPELFIVILNLASYYYNNKSMGVDKKLIPDSIYQSILSMHNTKIL